MRQQRSFVKFLPGVVICPVADDLQAVGQVAVRVGEVGLQLQGCSVALDGFRDVPAVLVHGREVGVRVRKRRVDLYSARVALQRPLDVVHFLQGVAHVAVRVRKCRLDPDGLLVVEQRLVQLPLLLQDGGEVAVRRRKLREHLKGLQVQPRGLLDVSLLPLDVGEVVEAVGVGGGELERRVVTLLALHHQTLLLQGVGKVAVGVGEVWLQLDGPAVGVDGEVDEAL